MRSCYFFLILSVWILSVVGAPWGFDFNIGKHHISWGSSVNATHGHDVTPLPGDSVVSAHVSKRSQARPIRERLATPSRLDRQALERTRDALKQHWSDLNLQQQVWIWVEGFMDLPNMPNPKALLLGYGEKFGGEEFSSKCLEDVLGIYQIVLDKPTSLTADQWESMETYDKEIRRTLSFVWLE